MTAENDAHRTLRVRANGVDLNVRIHGTDRLPAVVLLHALGQSAKDWDRVAERLADVAHVIAPDMRGHGASARAPAYSFEAMRDDVLALLAALEIERTALIGHSMGGTVAYLVAQARADLVSHLVIEDTPPPRNASLPEPPAEPPGEVPFDWALVAPIVRQLNAPDPTWWERLATIRSPTLLIGGGDESPIPQALLAEVAQRIPVHGSSRSVAATTCTRRGTRLSSRSFANSCSRIASRAPRVFARPRS